MNNPRDGTSTSSGQRRFSNTSHENHSNRRRERQKYILVLHGNKQTGQLLLSRLKRIQKRLSIEFPMDDLEMIAIDAPFPFQVDDDASDDNQDKDDTLIGDSSYSHDDSMMLTWWYRHGNDYNGLEETLKKIQFEIKDKKNDVVGLFGFSQGARLVHLLTLLHTQQPRQWFPNLQFVILVSGYDAPIPSQLPINDCKEENRISNSIKSLHIWGLQDNLVLPDQSEAVTHHYVQSQTYIHSGRHFVPTKSPDLQIYIDFIRTAMKNGSKTDSISVIPSSTTNHEGETQTDTKLLPDEETAALQQEEVQALEAIFPDEIVLKSSKSSTNNDNDDDEVYDFPIIYHFKLLPSNEDDNDDNNIMMNTNWPPKPLTLQIQYPYNYPLERIPVFSLIHENTVFEFPSRRSETILKILQETATGELGMPCVLSCIYAIKEYMNSPVSDDDNMMNKPSKEECKDVVNNNSKPEYLNEEQMLDSHHCLVKPSSPDEIEKGNLEGLEIAEMLLEKSNNSSVFYKGGGSFGTYTIGLVGKPSAGKSTFFNAATAFSRQRGQQEGEGDASEWGGASMAAHPFTTIDPNIGYCLVPAPLGLCPEDRLLPKEITDSYGSTHGRDPNGRRFLPVLLKDVAGLVPGAYEGRGKGNQFLNDLTDATVLIHMVDASGSADSSGNKIISDESVDNGQLSNPLDDLEWIRKELVEWVYSNLLAKWDTIARKGRSKLAGMFSGYGQREAMVETIFAALEKFLEYRYGRDHALDQIANWSECDVHRLVSLFLGVRFPMALCLNKYDLQTSKTFVQEIQHALPIHGAHVGTPLSAKAEMKFMKEQMSGSKVDGDISPPYGVWRCLSSAMTLREPVLVFPVSDMLTFAPMPGLNKAAAEDHSLPSKEMIQCILASGGSPPSSWNSREFCYEFSSNRTRKNAQKSMQLRDVLIMKQGSTVEDVFFTLKRMGALAGEFVRAEACSGRSNEKPKPVPKAEVVTWKICVIKIMSNKKAT